MKIGFIGLGNMATAMIGGMLQKGIAKPEDIIGSSKTETTAEKVKTKFNINTTTDNTDDQGISLHSRQESTVSEGCI